MLRISFVFSVFLSTAILGVTASFSGTFRTRTNYLDRANLGQAGTLSNKKFIDGRVLVYPNIIVDDHFSVKSQWSLLNSPKFAPSPAAGGGGMQGQGGWVYGDPDTTALVLNRAWLEWTSDFGVFRLGRAPVAWGYGLLWDAGNGMWDDWQSTLDRLEYRLHFGHVVSTLAYSKPRKISLMGSENDADFYTVALRYENPELDLEFGGLYEKQSRSTSQIGDLNGAANPYAFPTGTVPASPYAPYPLHSGLSHPLENTVLDFYVKKTSGYLTLGGEMAWLSGTASTLGSAATQELNAWGLIVSSAYEYHKVKAFFEFLFASGDSDMPSGPMSGFVLMHRNRRAGILLGRELLGAYYGEKVNYGSMVVYGDANSFSGVYYVRPGFRFDWSPSWSSGIEVIWANKAAVQAGEEKYLGFEIDLGTEYSVYKNFDIGVTLAVLAPGAGLRPTDSSSVFGFQTTFGLKF